MSRLQTGKKEPGLDHPQTEESTSARVCQEKTLVKQEPISQKAKIEVYPHCIIFKPILQTTQGKKGPRKERSIIKKFSKRSRFRLFKLLAKIDHQLNFPPIFISLTYHYGHTLQKKSTKSQLNLFLTRLRQFDPKVQFIWRIELQERGAPHYHLIIFPGLPILIPPNKHYNIVISQIWHSIADPNSEAHSEYGCKVVNIRNYTQACSYLSKYIAKVENLNDDIIEGRHWGNSYNMPFKICRTIEYQDFQAKYIIEKIRHWLLEHGKELQAKREYLNIHSEQCIFMEPNTFKLIEDSDPPPGMRLN